MRGFEETVVVFVASVLVASMWFAASSGHL